MSIPALVFWLLASTSASAECRDTVHIRDATVRGEQLFVTLEELPEYSNARWLERVLKPIGPLADCPVNLVTWVGDGVSDEDIKQRRTHFVDKPVVVLDVPLERPLQVALDRGFSTHGYYSFYEHTQFRSRYATGTHLRLAVALPLGTAMAATWLPSAYLLFFAMPPLPPRRRKTLRERRAEKLLGSVFETDGEEDGG